MKRLALLLALLLPSLAAGEEIVGLPEESVLPEAPTDVQLPAPQTRVFWVGVQLDVSHQYFLDNLQIYGKKAPFGFQGYAAVLSNERVGLGVAVGVHRRTGTGLIADAQKEEVLSPDTVLWQIPTAIDGWLRLAMWRDQPVVPTMRGGFDAVYWSEKTTEGTPEDGLVEEAVAAVEDLVTGETDEEPAELDFRRGWAFGIHLAGGLQIRMPFPEVQWEGGMGGAAGVINDVYLHLEARVRWVNTFNVERHVDLSSVGASAGITVLF